MIKQLIKVLRGTSFFYDQNIVFQEHTRNYERTLLAIRLFYGFSFLHALNSLNWMIEQYETTIFNKPLWVLGWAKPESLYTILCISLFVWMFSSLIAMLSPLVRSARVAQALSVLCLVAIINSEGHFGHYLYGFMYISLALIFLPRKKQELAHQFRIYKHRFVLTFWFAQLMICTFYLMTGYWKVASITECLIKENLVCQLDHKILTNISAQEALNYLDFAPLRDLFFKHPWIAFWSYMGTIWIHLVSLHFLFRPNLHRVFGFLRLVFHMGTFLFFGVNFTDMAAAVGVIFIFSPFDRTKSLRETLHLLSLLPPFKGIQTSSKYLLRMVIRHG